MSDALAFKFDGKEYRLPTLMLAEARAMQKATGRTPNELFQAIQSRGDVEALSAVIWVAQKRDNPNLRFDDVDGDLASFELLGSDGDDEGGDALGEDVADPPETEPGPPPEAA